MTKIQITSRRNQTDGNALVDNTPFLRAMFLRLISLVMLSCLMVLAVHAQGKKEGESIITGRLVDSLSHQPIEYGTIGLFAPGSSTPVNGGITDSTGLFRLTNVAPGRYEITFDFLGYKKVHKQDILVSESGPGLDIGTIIMSPTQTVLRQVTVTSERSIVENKIDRTVYNVDKDITSQTGVATDVLKKIPQVSVDVDGNVELQGSGGVRFLIDGKPSVMFGNNVAEVLQSIPASQIQSIEVITIPGARYDAAGTGGIINILLKKNKAQGTNGNVSLSAGTRLENGAFNLNMRKKNFGVHAFFSGNAHLTSTTIHTLDRFSPDSLGTTHLIQKGTSDFSRHGYESGLGFDWDLSPKNSLTGRVGYDYVGNNTAGADGREFISMDSSGNNLGDTVDRLITSDQFHESSLETELDYKKTFEKEDKESSSVSKIRPRRPF